MQNKIRILFSWTVILFFTFSLNAQKLVIDSTTYGKWPTFNGKAISNDGKYVYFITHNPVAEKDTLCIRSTETKWKVDLLGMSSAQFTQDSRKIVFKSNDSLCSIDLGNSSIHYVEGPVTNYVLLEKGRADNLLVCTLKNSSDQLAIKVMRTGVQRLFSSIENYWFDANRGVFLFQTHEKLGENMVYHLKQFDFNDNVAEDLGECDKIDKLVFCKDGSQFAYITRDVIGKRAIWYCESGKQKPVKLIEDQSNTIASGLKIDDVLALNNETGQLFFTLIKTDTGKKITDPVGVDVWNYKDPKLQSQQLVELKSNLSPKKTYKALFRIPNHQLVMLETDNEELQNFSIDHLPKKWILLYKKGTGDLWGEGNWNKNATKSLYLLSLADGSRRLVSQEALYTAVHFVLSPDENFLLFYDPLKSNYYSYEIARGVYRNLTATIRTKWTMRDDDEPLAKFRICEMAGFVKGYDYALIYDRYDIYKVDLTGKKMPVNLTRGFGRSHHLVLRVALRNQSFFDPSEKLILHAFNTDTKDEGYYSIFPDKQETPVCLTMQPAKIDITKARDTEAYLVDRMDAKESPNIFFTNDLTSFSPISNLHPENAYSWLSAELVTWKSLDGVPCQGILYKPEDFDPKKKYPMIIHYYERHSDELHRFLYPRLNIGGEINIPFFVSHGYLVFVPDIHYKIGYPGRSAYNCVVAGANTLCKRQYVDAKRIGLQGHSFGGFETNYIITHTKMFAAAMSASGMSDFVSIYFTIMGDGSSRMRQYEIDRDRMGATVWQIPGLYIENSPVIRANLVTTPVLIMANNNDGTVSCQQGIELFTALRRLEKKAWMLQYDEQGHVVLGKAADDFTIRVFQFFNYYLKGDYPPLWMTEGVPAIRKGMFTGLELDKTGRKP